MCNNSPAESTSPENGWRCSDEPMLGRRNRDFLIDVLTSRKVAAVSIEGAGASPAGATAGADLGGSSEYSDETSEDRSGEGFHVNSSWTWVSRS